MRHYRVAPRLFMGCSTPCAVVFNQLSSEKGGDILQRDVQAVGVFFLLMAGIAMLASGSLLSLFMWGLTAWVVFKIRSEL